MKKHSCVVVAALMAILWGAVLLQAPTARAQGNPPVPQAEAGGQGRAGIHKPGEILVKFKSGVGANGKAMVHAQRGSTKIKEFRRLGIHQVKLPPGLAVSAAVSSYKADSRVEYAEPNYLFHVDAVPDDPRFGELYGLDNNGQSGGTADADIDAPEAWDITSGDASVVVAVIDSGIDYSHEDLSANMWTNPGEIPGNAIDDDGNGYIDDIYGIDAVNGDADPFDDHGHGTHVAGTIGAVGNNGIGVTGVNWNVRIMAFKFLAADGYGDSAGAVECLEYIRAMKDSGVNIVATNNSWGGGLYSQALADAIVAQDDIIFFAAAGNDTLNNDTYPHYPSSYDQVNVVAVASTDHNDNLAYNSCYGRRSVDLAAPGVSILSTLPAVNIWSLPGPYNTLSGTSMATPHVTGTAALLMAQDPLRTWPEVRNLILSSGDPLASLNGITLTGKRLNAVAAMSCAGRQSFSALEYPSPAVPGVAAPLSVLSIDCGLPVGPVQVEITDGGNVTTLDLFDDGLGADTVAGDGIFTALWTPVTDDVQWAFSSPIGSETVVNAPPGGGTIDIQPATLPTAYLDDYYEVELIPSGGFPPYMWSIVQGSLPADLWLDDFMGWIAGTPRTTGVFNFTVQVEDPFLETGTRAYSLQVRIRHEILTAFLPEASPGVPYSVTLTSRGENPPDTWSIASGSLPDGLILDAVTGEIAGTPTTFGTSSFTVQVTDIVSDTATKDMHIHVVDTGTVPLWSAVYDGGNEDQGRDVVSDGAGNVYVTGSRKTGNNQDCLTVKYDPDGFQLWERTYDGPTQAADWGWAITVDRSSGDVYVTGSAQLAGYNPYNVLVIKYSPDGTEEWVRTYPGTAVQQKGAGIAVDSSGNVLVVASHPQNDAQFLKYDGDGNLLLDWVYDAGGTEYPSGLTLDNADNIYVSGSSNAQGWIAKFDPLGNLLWSNVSPNFSPAVDVGVSPSGDVTTSGRSGSNIVTEKYDADGNTLWTRTFLGSPSAAHYVWDMAVDDLGSTYVAAQSYGDSLSTYPWDFLTVKYDASGNLVWVERTDNGDGDTPQGIAIDSAGAVIVTGYTGTVYTYDILTVKYAQPDADGDGYDLPADCNDLNPDVSPAGMEVCDGIDNNCDGTIDEGFDNDGDGYTVCMGDCNDLVFEVNPGATELPYNGVDENCNGMADDDDLDQDGFGIAADCDDNDPAINPDACDIKSDGIDQDCDGADRTKGKPCDSGGECTPTPGEETEELTCDDGADNDCDGKTDSADPDCDVCTITEDPEVSCSDGQDNDCDGYVDSADPDCPAGTCDGYTTRQSCNGDPNCEWNRSDGICKEASPDCGSYPDQTSCETAGCSWNNKKQQCR